MSDFLHACRVVAVHEIVDAFRSRRAIILLVLYLLGSVASCLIFLKVLHDIENQLVETLQLSPTEEPGSVTNALWESKQFRRFMGDLVGDRALAERLLAIPPLALYYGWLSMFFSPLLVMLLSTPRIAEEVQSGSVRFALFRCSRGAWCWGKFLGQGVMLMAALLVSAAGAWGVGVFRMAGFAPWATIPFLLVFSLKAWVYAWAFLGIALGVSQVPRSPIVATGAGLVVWMGIWIMLGVRALVARHFGGGFWERTLDVVHMLTPQGHRLALWNPDLPYLLPGVVMLLTLGVLYFLLGHTVFGRRDQ